MHKVNFYKISTYLIIFSIINFLLILPFNENLSSIINFYISIFLLISFKKLINEKFLYYKVDKLIRWQLLISLFLLPMPSILNNEIIESFISIKLISEIFNIVIGFSQIIMGKVLIRDKTGYPDIFPTFAKFYGRWGFYSIFVIIFFILSEYYIEVLNIVSAIFFIPTTISRLISTIYLFRIFNRASKNA